jgi:hypothetical protein
MYSIRIVVCGVAFFLPSPIPCDKVPRRPPPWLPRAGTVVTYAGRSRETRNVRVVAEASAGWMVVEAIGRHGLPVRFSVKQRNLEPLQPGLFDHESDA